MTYQIVIVKNLSLATYVCSLCTLTGLLSRTPACACRSPRIFYFFGTASDDFVNELRNGRMKCRVLENLDCNRNLM
jgi:hypothetical protein